MGRLSGRIVALALVFGRWAWTRASQRPVDSVAALTASGLTLVIMVNALFLQSGSHPAPSFFVNPSPPPAEAPVQPKVAERTAVKPAPPPIPPQSNDAIAELIGPSPRIMAVQRVLAEFGYGQVRASGLLDGATSNAIERFERDHKMPVTGHVSDRLVHELGVMSGQPVQ